MLQSARTTAPSRIVHVFTQVPPFRGSWLAVLPSCFAGGQTRTWAQSSERAASRLPAMARVAGLRHFLPLHGRDSASQVSHRAPATDDALDDLPVERRR